MLPISQSAHRLIVPFLTKQTQRTIVMCAIDWSSIGMKQYLYASHQHSEKRIDIHCKVTFDFKYINVLI